MTAKTGKCLIFSAPSGAGKTTIVHRLLALHDDIAFSVSACSRPPRPNEIHGKDYYFFSVDSFKEKINQGAFIEWEEVYPNHFYGTLKKEIERIWSEGKTVIFDVDVYGGISLKNYFGKQALSFFDDPPSIQILQERLRKRNTETEDKIKQRIGKAEEELLLKNKFDCVVVNKDLNATVEEVEQIVKPFLAL